MAGGASLSAASSGDNSVSTALSSGFAAAAGPSGLASPGLASEGLASEGLASEGLPSGLALASFLSVLSVFLSDDLVSDFSTVRSRIATRSLSPSIITIASGFSLARMPLAAAAQSAGSPLG